MPFLPLALYIPSAKESNVAFKQLRTDCGGHQSVDDNVSGQQNVPITLNEPVHSPTNPCTSLVIALDVLGVPTEAVVDTAAQVSIVSENFLQQLEHWPIPSETILLKGAQKQSCLTAKRLPNVKFEIGHKTYYWDLLSAPIEDTIILGLDFSKSPFWSYKFS